jgi:hypothetical protein
MAWQPSLLCCLRLRCVPARAHAACCGGSMFCLAVGDLPAWQLAGKYSQRHLQKPPVCAVGTHSTRGAHTASKWEGFYCMADSWVHLLRQMTRDKGDTSGHMQQPLPSALPSIFLQVRGNSANGSAWRHCGQRYAAAVLTSSLPSSLCSHPQCPPLSTHLCVLTCLCVWKVACRAFAQAHQLSVFFFELNRASWVTWVGDIRAQDGVSASIPAAFTMQVTCGAFCGCVEGLMG